MCTFHAYLI